MRKLSPLAQLFQLKLIEDTSAQARDKDGSYHYYDSYNNDTSFFTAVC